MSIAPVRTVRKCIAFLAAAAVPAAPLLSQPHRDLGLNENVFGGPRFVAHALRVKALDETGWDWPGSDEVWLERWDFDRKQIGPNYFSDFDTGESKSLPADKRCVSAQPQCTSGTSSLNFGFTLWEVDDWDVVELLGAAFCPGSFPYPTAEQEFDAEDEPITYPECETSGEDLIGKAKINLSRAELIALLPTVGQSVDRTVIPTGGSGRYEITYRITRLANVEPTISDGGGLGGSTVTITLQAQVVPIVGGSQVNLSWSGATTNTVDIFRNGAKIITTTNDGAHSDGVAAGTYQYRLCNLNSTTSCSPNAAVTVP